MNQLKTKALVNLIILFSSINICFGQGYDIDIESLERDYQLEIPNEVYTIYIIYQKRGPIVQGSSMFGGRGSREEFVLNFLEYIKQAKKANAKLVITADTEEGMWVHDLISYKGKRLRPTSYMDPNGDNKIYPGSEIQY